MRLILLNLIFFACQQQAPLVTIVEIKEVASKMDQGVMVLDVRTFEEFRSGHLQDAINIDFRSDQFSQEVTKLPINDPIIIHCASGFRSKNAGQLLTKLGFTEVYDFSGGYRAWSKAGMPIEK